VASVTAAPQHAPEAEDLDVVEVALSVLARKLRGELMLGLLEDFAAGRRSGRSMLAEFQRAEAAFTGERPALAGRASQGLRELVNHLGPAGARTPRRWTESVRRALTGGPPEWEPRPDAGHLGRARTSPHGWRVCGVLRRPSTNCAEVIPGRLAERRGDGSP
jgi:hypothetical protein